MKHLGWRAMSHPAPQVILDRVVAEHPTKIQERTLHGLQTVLVLLRQGVAVETSAKGAGVNLRTLAEWRSRYPSFGAEVASLIAENQRDRAAERAEVRREGLEEAGLVLRLHPDIPEPPGLAQWRWDYFGRPTPESQQTAIMALEDMTNLYVFIFGPTGMGKDTLAGDYASWVLCPDRTGLRCAWIMKVSEKGQRRLGRIARYLTDPAAIRQKPERTPGGQKPTRSLIEDYGPFKWQAGMVWEDGTEALRPKWRSDAFYFVQSVTPEADPNWQAVGLEGALQGDRIDQAVLSDVFDVENQRSPTERANQIKWVDGILHSRLDTYGRLVVLANMLPVENNYEVILDRYLADAEVLSEVTIGPGTYTKYSNGVAVVIIKAIYEDPETGEPRSYAPDRFPLEGHLVSPDETKIKLLSELTPEKQLALGQKGWKRGRGLYETRAKSPITFKAMYQQERDPDVSLIDFTQAVFDAAHDESRSFGQIMPNEIRLLGVDPARTYGAAWSLLGVDRDQRQITLVDWWWGEKLGYTGIKDKLLLVPIGRFAPSWLCWEDNRDGSVLGEADIYEIMRSAGMGLFKHVTGLERSSAEIGPGALASWMLAGQFRIPYRTSEDKYKAMDFESQAKAWDSSPDRSKPGRPGHAPDDAFMATWVAWLKARTMVDSRARGSGMVVNVPPALRASYDRRRQNRVEANLTKKGKKLDPRAALTRGNPIELIRSFADPDG